jgi:predicted O-methyltransferase YrrM
MMVPPEQGEFMANLLRVLQPRKLIEVGVFTGYSTLVTALATPADAKIYALDVSEEFVNVGKPYWEKAGVEGKIDLKIGPALA